MADPRQSKVLTTPKIIVDGLTVSKLSVQYATFGVNGYRVYYDQNLFVDVPYSANSKTALQFLENEAFSIINT